MKDGVSLHTRVMRLVADELDLCIGCCKRIVIDKVVCLLVDCVVVARLLTLDRKLGCCIRRVFAILLGVRFFL